MFGESNSRLDFVLKRIAVRRVLCDAVNVLVQAELAEAKQLAKQGQSLAKRVVVLCGGAHGLGPDIASRLVKEGGKVVIVDTDSASAKGKVSIKRVRGVAKTAVA